MPRHGGLALFGALLTVCGCECDAPVPVTPTGPLHRGEPLVWVVDDSHRIARASGASTLMQGSAVWAPDRAIKLFGLRDEIIAFQVVISAGDRPLKRVDVALTEATAGCFASRAFVVHELPMARRSGGPVHNQSLGWTAAAMPAAVAAGGALPDVLIPIDIAPSWADYPMTVPPNQHRVVWFDLHIAADAPPGECRAQLKIREGKMSLAHIPLRAQVSTATLPYRGVKTMLYYSPEELLSRFEDKRIIALHEQLLHRHHLSAIMPLRSAADVAQHGTALNGSLFTAAAGYRGPGIGVGSDIAVIGAYGSMGPPNAQSIAKVQQLLDALKERGVTAPTSDVFLYAVDEACDSPLTPAWRRALDAAGGELAQLKVGHTCSTPPSAQPADVVMVMASEYDTVAASTAIKAGKQVWIYNGVLPYTGSFLSDGWPLSLRANAWIQARYGIERWFYWESTFWNDDNRGGLGPYDPLATAETFHNADMDHCNGDGVLMYPATQRDGFRSLDSLQVLPSIRLKQWRRGISDMGYLKLARDIDREAADAVLESIVPQALQHAKGLSAPPFSVSGRDYRQARRSLFRIINGP